MNELIERYIHDVIRRLPEKDRAEIERELRANIYDMLPENYTEEDVVRVLKEMGDPASLAEKYRVNPRYLISPASFDSYVYFLKLIIPIVAGVLFVLSVISESVDLLKTGGTDAISLIASSFAHGIEAAVAGAVQAGIWITIGFFIYERVNGKDINIKGEWNPHNLPPIVKQTNKTIPLSDSIAELVLTIVGAIIGIGFFSGLIFAGNFIVIKGTKVNNIFLPEFSDAVIPIIILTAILGIIKHSVRIIFRKWNLAVCLATVLTSLVGMVASVHLLITYPVFSAELIELLNTLGLNTLKNAPILADRGIYIIIDIIVIIIIVSTVSEVISAFVKTLKPEKYIK
ncbi:MAG: hypothetical protein GXY95_08015 [Clostridiales bacterium]|jgi:hypothetical protein|nr:hypothetical protein [Clostridiales bacterium]